MFTKILKISFFLILLFVSSCGLKKSWEESGVYTADKSLPSTYIWKKGKQYIAIVQQSQFKAEIKKIQFILLIFLQDTISSSFSKINYTILDKKKGRKK